MSNQLLDDFEEYDGLADDQLSLQPTNRLKQQLYPHLKAHETIEWIGQPKQGFFFRDKEQSLMPFSLGCAGFTFVWELIAMLGKVYVLAIFGIPFVLASLYLLFFRFIQDIIQRKKTIYALSSHRLILKKGDKLQAYPYRKIRKIELRKHKNGSGTILFNDGLMSSGKELYTPEMCLDYLEDAEPIYNSIKKRMKK